MKIAFMGTPFLALECLESLARDHEIAVVVTQPDKIGGRRNHELLAPPVKKWAFERQIPVLQPKRARDEEFVAQLASFEVEAIAVVAYGQILPDSVLQMAPKGCVNLHFSLLPRWRGAAPVQYAIWNGDQKTGVTTQWMAQKLDAGDIIQQIEVEIEARETSGELLARLTTLGARVLSETFQMLEAQNAPRRAQNEAEATFCPQISKEMAHIDWAQSAAKIVNTARAMNPWPVAWCDFRGEALKIWRAEIAEQNGANGTVLALEKDAVVVGAGEESVRILEVQAPNKGRMKASDWARGARFEIGAVLSDFSSD